MARRESKPEIAVPRKAAFAASLHGERATGWIVRLSVVGVEIESLQPPAIGSDVTLWAELVEGDAELVFRGRVQWATQTRFGVQFGQLGARATYAVVRASGQSAV